MSHNSPQSKKQKNTNKQINQPPGKINKKRNTPVASKKAKHTLQHAFQEHYRALTLLNNYKVLNYTGIIKIIKKYEKASSIVVVFLFFLHEIEGRWNVL